MSPCLGMREAAWLTLWIWRQILVNSNEGFWLAMDRVGVCHPEMASEMLLCQFGRFMHTMPKCTPRAVLKHLLGSHIPY